MKTISQLDAICFAIGGFTLWVLADGAMKLAGQSRLPNYEVIAFLGLFIAAFLTVSALWRGGGEGAVAEAAAAAVDALLA